MKIETTTKDEVIHLVKYWVRRAIDDEYFTFWGQYFGSSDLRRIDLDWKRVNEIAQILGKEETDKAVTKAYAETAPEFGREDWTVFRYGTWDEQNTYRDKGGQFLSDFEPGEAEEIVCRVVQRVFREGTAEEQQALLRDELTRYARKRYSYNRGGNVVEMFGVSFPSAARSLIPSTGVDVPSSSGLLETISIEQGKAFLEALNETSKKGDAALQALAAGYEWAS